MKIVDAAEKHPPFDVASGLAEVLIASGLCKVWKQPAPTKPLPDTIWSAKEGKWTGAGSYPPYVFVKCNHCGTSVVMEPVELGRIGKVPFRHQGGACGFHRVVEYCPTDVAEQYDALLKAFKKEKPGTKPESKKLDGGMTLLIGTR